MRAAGNPALYSAFLQEDRPGTSTERIRGHIGLTPPRKCEISRHAACSLSNTAIMARFFSALLLAGAVCASGCVRAQPPTDTGDPVASSPTAPTAPTGT